MDYTLTLLGVGAVVVLLAFSAFFSSTEIAIFSLSAEWIDRQAATSDRRASILKELRDDPHRLLVTVLVGNNLVNVAISSIVTAMLVTHFSAGIAVTVATLAVGFVVLVFGEIVPKSYGLGNAERWALATARPISLVGRSLSPLVTLFDVLTTRINERIGGEREIETPYVD